MNILVVGFYNKQNIGDQLFIDAFNALFPDINFIFTNYITKNNIGISDTIFIGGGSFLFSEPFIDKDCFDIVKTKNIFYISVGMETDIHPLHIELLKLAKLIALRSESGINKIKYINNNIIIIPDITYSLKFNKSDIIYKSVGILSNIEIIPQNSDPHWKYNSWNNFKFEFSQFLDFLIEKGYNIHFFAMSDNVEHNDNCAASEIINSMKYRNNYIITSDINLLSGYEYIITQRYHGIILAEIMKIPYLSVFHHDKLKQSFFNSGSFLSYYNSSKQLFIDEFYKMKKQEVNNIKSDIFDILKYRVNSILYMI